MPEKKRSFVKWFDTSKGYGFIDSPDGDVFVHYRSIEPETEGFKNLDEGDEVEYIETTSAKGLQAAEVEIIKKAKFNHTEHPLQPPESDWQGERHGAG